MINTCPGKAGVWLWLQRCVLSLPCCRLPCSLLHSTQCPQGLSGSDVENVGYVIPTPVVHHFLTDYVENGKITGFPGLGIQWQRMESEALRQAHHMKPGQKGEQQQQQQ